MLIGTFFKRPKAPIDLPNADGSRRIYYFKPIDPTNPDSEHVCEVDDNAHAQLLLKVSEGYYISSAQTAAAAAASVVAAQRPPVPTPPKPPAPVRPPIDPMDAGTTSIDSLVKPVAQSAASPQEAVELLAQQSATLATNNDAEKAAALVELKLAQFKDALPNTPRGVVEAALQIELGRSEDYQRPTFIKNLQNALKA